MSLSFVSSAVLSSSDGVSHNQEKSIESKEVQSLRTLNRPHKPLFDQLRSNKEAEQAQYDENTKAMMGMRTLDEEECAHLDAVEQQRRDNQDLVKMSVEEELAKFRAARADRRLVESSVDLEEEDATEQRQKDGASITTIDNPNTAEKQPQQPSSSLSTIRPKLIPKIIGKKRRKKAMSPTDASTNKEEMGSPMKKRAVDALPSSSAAAAAAAATATSKTEDNTQNEKDNSNKDVESEDEGGGGLGGLLGCYGSDDDSD